MHLQPDVRIKVGSSDGVSSLLWISEGLGSHCPGPNHFAANPELLWGIVAGSSIQGDFHLGICNAVENLHVMYQLLISFLDGRTKLNDVMLGS